MDLRHRLMQPRDVPECAKIIATHPVIGPRYGTAIADLRPAWLQLLDCEAQATLVLEELDGPHATICFVGVAVFVGDGFVRELKRPPLKWIGPELARRIQRNNSPLLSDRQLREANSCDAGLTTLTWEACIRTGFEKHTEIHRRILGMYIEHHRGYFWNEAIASQLESAERLQWTLQSGGWLWDPASGRYVDSLAKDPQEIFRRPHIVGVTREIERSKPGSWVGALFDYHPPQLGFSRGEQRLLLSALSSETDEELSGNLGMSLSTVKNTWRSIYNRAALLPELIPNHSQADERSSKRGKEKKRRLLAYLRDHPEELRPISRKLLQQASTQRRSSRKPKTA
jgi:hypothetical protein